MDLSGSSQPCVLCATSTSTLVTGTAQQERVAAAPMCTGCLHGMRVQAAERAIDCPGCAVVSGQKVVDGQVLHLLADADLHVPACVTLAKLVLLRPTPAQAWVRRRELSMTIMHRLRVESTASGLRPWMFAYRDERLVAQIVVRPFATVTQKERAFREVVDLANAVRATQARLVSDVWFKLAATGPPDESIANDPAARSALFALDWDSRQPSTTFELVPYAFTGDGHVVFEQEPLDLPAGVTGEGRFVEVLREATRRRPTALPVHLARRLEARGHEVVLIPSGPRAAPWPARADVEPRGIDQGPEIEL